MTVKDFDKLTKRDFENGAVRDEIRKSLRTKELYAKEIDRLNALLSTADDQLISAHFREVKLVLEVARLDQLLNPKPIRIGGIDCPDPGGERC